MNPEIAYEEIAQCRFPAELRCIRSALDKLGAYCRGHGLRPTLWNQVELAVAEGLNNAVEHGCAGIANAQVVLRWSWTLELLRIEMIDPGRFVPPPSEASLPEDLLAEGGRGAAEPANQKRNDKVDVIDQALARVSERLEAVGDGA